MTLTAVPAKIIGYDMQFSLDPVDDSCILYVALLIEGRLRRQSRWRSQAWRPAAAVCNRRLGRQGTARQALRPGCEEHRCTDAEEMPQTVARPRPKIATVERREARVPASWGRTCAASWAVGVRVMHPSAFRRTANPRSWPNKVQAPGAMRRGNESGLPMGQPAEKDTPRGASAASLVDSERSYPLHSALGRVVRGGRRGCGIVARDSGLSPLHQWLPDVHSPSHDGGGTVWVERPVTPASARAWSTTARGPRRP